MTVQVSLWSNVQVYMQSALATAIVMTAITKANPGVVTYTGADPSNGDYIVLSSVVGMSEVDGRVFRVANVNAGSNTLELEGEDTTNYGTFVSGNAQVITFGTQMISATNLSASGGDFDFEDTTTIHDTVRTQVPTVAQAAVYTFENLWDIADAALIALKNASILKTKRVMRFTFSNGYKMLFNGYVGATLLPVGAGQAKVTTQVAITMHGRPTYYST